MKIQNGKKLILFWRIIKRSYVNGLHVYVGKDMHVHSIIIQKINEEIQRNINTSKSVVMNFDENLAGNVFE